jgi:Ser/Thr protein kinase RdoA (MazF antagonist)
VTVAPDQLAEVLRRYGLPGVAMIAAPASGGLVHETAIVTLDDRRRVVVQRMHPAAPAAVLDDLEAVTAHLVRAGQTAPRLLRTPDGALGVVDRAGRWWRILTHLDGITVDRLPVSALAEEAGALVARFHQALGSLEHEFRVRRGGIAETGARVARLERARAGGDDPALAALAGEILDAARGLSPLGALPARIGHGDLKISNVLFGRGAHGPDRARALLDLDTVGPVPLAYELGEALRSWCNPRGDDVADTAFDLASLEAALRGYAGVARGQVSAVEVAGIVGGLHTVCVWLAMRFCTDGFEDRYFGWDPARFPSRREHNRVRAAGQIALAHQVAALRADAERIVAAAFG